MTSDKFGSAFEVEAASIQEFLWLLKEREEGEVPPRGPRGATRRAVFVSQMLDQRSSSYGYLLVTRHVVAAFAYGQDAVSYRRTTSNAVELTEIAGRTEERQQKAYEEIRAEIERGLKEVGLDLSVHEGFLHRPANTGNGQ